MIADDEASPEKEFTRSGHAVEKAKERSTRTRRKITYVSRHFVEASPRSEPGSARPSQRSQPDKKRENYSNKAKRKRSCQKQQQHDSDERPPAALATPPVTPARPRPRVYYGLNIDDLSSDSSLSDVPDDIGPDPFSSKADSPPPPPPPPLPASSTPTGDQTSLEASAGLRWTASPEQHPAASTVQAIKTKTNPEKKKVRRPTKSPYFPHPHKHRPTFLSTLPFPPLSHTTFGLMQERLAHDPFRLLIATIFLNKTPGERAMPIFYQLMSRYPTPADLAGAEVSEITSMIYGLGFQNQRAKKCVAMAKAWLANPPRRGKRYRKLNYPCKGDGKDVREDEVLADDEIDGRVAWEISHLPGLGPYSHDSWRIFCRDQLRGIGPKGGDGEDVATRASGEGEGEDDDDDDPAAAAAATICLGLKDSNQEIEEAPPLRNPSTGHRGVECGRQDQDGDGGQDPDDPRIQPEAQAGHEYDHQVPPTPTPTTHPHTPFEPEWKRVIPTDKELRAYLTWKWLQEGWVWNKETGQRTKAPAALLDQARGGGIVVEERDSDHLIVNGVEGEEVNHLQAERKVERTASDFLPLASTSD
ncbi:hypothetical protein A1O1_01414 [Capronia coronata CBS 617.96]|uniref:HhH-GPD domain-containing protein n=1 Tax=Capronia coronata CBS 617.96 TaxID=1182541 RepID=W9YUU7_9EURO|nr:uncharacterized protein A1O1_01414 [Capronia coronata CBS 617.96]EXJ96288.1 hypothetical protein A1O1_01414 [Capronia coronata CBS 617.96]